MNFVFMHLRLLLSFLPTLDFVTFRICIKQRSTNLLPYYGSLKTSFFYFSKYFSLIDVQFAGFKQALWLHRRFLSTCWISNFLIDSGDGKEKIGMYHDFGTFIQNELSLLHSSTAFTNDDFADFQAQASYSASYMLWLKVVCKLFSIRVSIL